MSSKTGDDIYVWFNMAVEDLAGRDVNYILVTDSGPNYVSAFKDTEVRISCIAHSINLAVKELFQVIEKKANDNSKFCSNILKECKRIATWANHSKPEELVYTIKNICKTRWNTHLTLFRSIEQQFDVVMKLVHESLNLKTSFNKEQLVAMIEFLTPFETATVQTSSSEEPTLHLVISWLHQLIRANAANAGDVAFVSFLRETIISTIEKKIFPKLKRIHCRCAIGSTVQETDSFV